jgi:hypothetical protein
MTVTDFAKRIATNVWNWDIFDFAKRIAPLCPRDRVQSDQYIQEKWKAFRALGDALNQFSANLMEKISECNELPPDPEGMNDQRCAWAGEAIAVFMLATGTDLGDAVSDLLADIMHWCNRHDIVFEDELTRAVCHYGTECRTHGAE